MQAEFIEWIWRNRIPHGKLTVLDGDPGVGKSTIVMNVAARVSSRRGLPGRRRIHGPRRRRTGEREYDLADTMCPRLEAAGANLERVTATTSGPHIEVTIETADVALDVFDPLTAFLYTTTAHDIPQHISVYDNIILVCYFCL